MNGVLPVRKILVFFNGNDPYSVDVGEHLNSYRLQYPDKTLVDLPIQSCIYPGKFDMQECFFVSDRQLVEREVIEANERLR
ncbi:hypothetical protein ACOIFF_22475 [Klebsiella pneumoniae]|uniref:hypothetical protein n=1 Tax=Klebsiella pneumoniae TaxID=573 RepID=UPI003B5B0E8C